MTPEEKIDLFFKNPVIEPDGATQGVLYLLRREVQDCFIGKVVPEDQVIAESQKDRHRLFATMMVIMAGIDLLAKFYAGSDENGGVGLMSPGSSSVIGSAWISRSGSLGLIGTTAGRSNRFGIYEWRRFTSWPRKALSTWTRITSGT